MSEADLGPDRRKWMYHRKHPEGKIFDPTGLRAPYPPPASEGWVDHRGELNMSTEQMTDQMVENAVRAELKAQGAHRQELDREHKKKFGVEPDMRATTEEVANVMDNKRADGAGKLPRRLVEKT